MFGEVRLRPDVSASATCFAQDTYPNLLEYSQLTPFRLTEEVFRQISANNHITIAHLPLLLLCFP